MANAVRCGLAERLRVALVRGVHGLRGAVRVEILTDRPEDRYAVGLRPPSRGLDAPLTVTWSSAGRRRAGLAAAVRRGARPDRPPRPSSGPTSRSSPARRALAARLLLLARGRRDDGDRRPTGQVLGTVRDVYRSGGAEVYIVAGGPYGEFDVPAVRDFVRIFAPRRGEIVVDTEALDLDAAVEPGRRPPSAPATPVRGAPPGDGGTHARSAEPPRLPG